MALGDPLYSAANAIERHFLPFKEQSSRQELRRRPPRLLEFDCGEQWRAPSPGHNHIDPYTGNLVVVNRQLIPLRVIQELQFTNPTKHHSLVCEFEYGKSSGDIFYDISERDNLEEDGYGRLITLNWWYQALFQVLVNASLIFLDLYSNAIFCFNLVCRYEFLHVAREVAWFFPGCYIVLETLTVAHAYFQTKKEWNVKAQGVGDLIADPLLNRVDAHHAFWAMVFFCFLGVDTLVRDIVVWLHPFKNVQPYSAFKCDGHRCYVIGWANEYMFRCDSMVRQHVLMITQVGVRLILLTFKFSVALQTWDIISLGLCVPSVVLLYYRVLKIWDIIRDRQQHWEWLNKERRKLEQRMQTEALRGDIRNWERVLNKQRSIHFPGAEWGSPFKGWRNLWVRFSFAVLLPASTLLIYLLADMFFHGHWAERSEVLGAQLSVGSRAGPAEAASRLAEHVDRSGDLAGSAPPTLTEGREAPSLTGDVPTPSWEAMAGYATAGCPDGPGCGGGELQAPRTGEAAQGGGAGGALLRQR